MPYYYLGTHTTLPLEAVAQAKLGKHVRLDWRGGGSWRTIEHGGSDGVIDALAHSIKQLAPHQVLLSFFHEPEDQAAYQTATYGTAGDFAGAFRHIHNRFAADGVGNVVWVWAVMGWSGWNKQYTGGLYPGDAYVDWISWDPYNWYTCHANKWAAFADVIRPFYSWLEANGHGNKPFMLSEVGSREGPAGAKAQWFSGLVPALKSGFPNMKAVLYFDGASFDNQGRMCDFRIDTSTSSLLAYKAAGHDPYVNQPR
jgi:beta-mannanase